MTLSQLATKYPDVRFEVSNGKKRLARVLVEYRVTGNMDSLAKFLEDLDSEWPFAVQQCKQLTGGKAMLVQVEYIVKPDETEEFIKRVPYRGEEIAIGF